MVRSIRGCLLVFRDSAEDWKSQFLGLFRKTSSPRDGVIESRWRYCGIAFLKREISMIRGVVYSLLLATAKTCSLVVVDSSLLGTSQGNMLRRLLRKPVSRTRREASLMR